MDGVVVFWLCVSATACSDYWLSLPPSQVCPNWCIDSKVWRRCRAGDVRAFCFSIRGEPTGIFRGLAIFCHGYLKVRKLPWQASAPGPEIEGEKGAKKTTKILLGWEKNLWPWETLVLPHNWGETSILGGQFGLLNCKDDVCITPKNATTIQCYHLHLPTCSMTIDKWQFLGMHAASVHGYRRTKCFFVHRRSRATITTLSRKNSFEQKVVLTSRAFLQTSVNSR